MLSYGVLDANVVDVEKRRNPSKHYVSTEGGIRLAWGKMLPVPGSLSDGFYLGTVGFMT